MKRTLTIVLFLSLPLLLNGQKVQQRCTSLIDEAAADDASPWKCTVNAASMYIDSMPPISKVMFHYAHEDGDFNKANESDLTNRFGFTTYGLRSLKKIGLQGHFNYTRSYEHNVDWYTRFDPEEKNPFYVADSIGGNWLKERFNMGFGIAPGKPFLGITPSFRTEYTVSLGGRDNDPRPQSTSRRVVLYPSLTWASPKKWYVGMSGFYGNAREDIDIINESGVGSNTMYKVDGLSLYGQPMSKSTMEYRYNSYTVGVALQAGRRTSSWSWANELKYSQSSEKSIQSPYASAEDPETNEVYSTAIHDAHFLLQELNWYTGLALLSPSWEHCFQIHASENHGKTYIYETTQVEQHSRQNTVEITWHSYKKKEHKSIFLAGLNLKWNDQFSENYYYARQSIENFGITGMLTGFFTPGKKFRLEVGTVTGYTFDLNSTLHIEPESGFIPLSTDITNPLVLHDFEVMSTSYFKGQAYIVSYLPAGKSKHFFFRLSGGIIEPASQFDSIFSITGETGIIF